MRVDWCVSSWFRIKNTHSLTHSRKSGALHMAFVSVICHREYSIQLCVSQFNGNAFRIQYGYTGEHTSVARILLPNRHGTVGDVVTNRKPSPAPRRSRESCCFVKFCSGDDGRATADASCSCRPLRELERRVDHEH